jgi:2-phospho-L-lactate/phosphoenolpyruvate guanylyltransferase
MKVSVLIPVKSLTSAKSRLAKNLSHVKRTELVLQMLRHVLETIKSINDEYEIFVVTSDQKIKKFAKSFGAKIIEEETPDHNRALTYAAKNINQRLPLVTISADLPLLTTNDIKQMILFLKNNDVVLAPSKEAIGTNAIVMREPSLVPYQFGKNSLSKFINSAKKQKLRFQLYKSETIAFDVDTVQDLEKADLNS